MLNMPDWAEIFAPNGTLLGEGDMIHRTNFAVTLETIANLGVDAFYSPGSPIARAIVEKVRKEGGIMTLEDMDNYEVRIAEALEGSYRGRKVYTTGAPTSG